MPPIAASQLLLAAALALFAYPLIIYPALVALFVRSRRERPPAVPDEELPRVALIICALNEQRIIREKLDNCLALDYPKDKLRVVVVSDGSTDGTASIVREYESRGITLIEHRERRGKVANLNDLIPAVPEETVVLSDANVLYERSAVRNLVSRLRDDSVGCVSGRVVLRNTAGEIRSGEQDYYSIEWMLQEKASALCSMAGADGAMYAIQRRCFRPSPDDTLIEDFVAPIQVVRQGKRVVFEPAAVGWEEGPATLAEEYRRRVRIGAGAAQALIRGNGLPIGAPARFWFVFVSHKLLRWLAPVTGLAALVIAFLSREHMLAQAVLAGFVLVALLALVRWSTGLSAKPLDGAFYFLFGQMALLAGLLKGTLGKQSVLWAKADR